MAKRVKLKQLRNLCVWHKKNKKYYFVRTIRFGIGKIMRKYNIGVPVEGENIIDEIVLYSRPDSILRIHTFTYPYNTGQPARTVDIRKLDLENMTIK